MSHRCFGCCVAFSCVGMYGLMLTGAKWWPECSLCRSNELTALMLWSLCKAHLLTEKKAEIHHDHYKRRLVFLSFTLTLSWFCHQHDKWQYSIRWFCLSDWKRTRSLQDDILSKQQMQANLFILIFAFSIHILFVEPSLSPTLTLLRQDMPE